MTLRSKWFEWEITDSALRTVLGWAGDHPVLFILTLAMLLVFVAFIWHRIVMATRGNLAKQKKRAEQIIEQLPTPFSSSRGREENEQ